MATPHKNSPTRLPCTRTHQIGALTLVLTTFLLTRLFDRPPPCTAQYAAADDTWQGRGYGAHLSLKIYVYEESEIDGLAALLYGRDGKISADDCLKGQWGTQVS